MKALRAIWSSTDFAASELTRYAGEVMCREARKGIFVLGVLTTLLMLGFAVLYYALGMRSGYQYTFAILGLLALHVALSARSLRDIRVLYLLAMVLLAFSGLACALLAHRYGTFTATLFSTVVLLFMVVPLVPWGLREALAAVAIVYLIFTGSSLSVGGRFPPEALWTLQFLMVSAALISLCLVCYAIVVRKEHLEARFHLTAANERLARASVQDSLTGAWNRRFLEERFDQIIARYTAGGHGCALSILDVDKFKQLNDTYGHGCGDQVLRRTVAMLAAALHQDEYVVRLGGDEFLVLMKDAAARERLEQIRERLSDRAGLPPEVPAMPSVSIGLARAAAGSPVSLSRLYLLADRSLYEAKARGRGMVCEAVAQAEAEAA